MRNLFLALALLAPLSASAASITPAPNSITIIYTNAAGTIVASPSASVTPAAFTAFTTYCPLHYSGTPSAQGSTLGCFNTWANDVYITLLNNMQQAAQSAAAATATAAVVPPAIVPAQ